MKNVEELFLENEHAGDSGMAEELDISYGGHLRSAQQYPINLNFFRYTHSVFAV